ncbi:MAG: HEPN domain-containing protein [Acidobacteriaceae bacterium]
MNRKDFQNLSGARLREAQVLFRQKQYSGAYYLAGYAVECALKACIAKQTRRFDFPDWDIVKNSYTHNLSKLAGIANLEGMRLQRANQDPIFGKNWALAILWSEESRYRSTGRADCVAFLNAIMEEQHGVLPWLRPIW